VFPLIFEYGDYRFDLILNEPVNSKFLEATIRGGFGYVFKSTVCINTGEQCSECESKYSCVYQYIFETIPPQNTEKMKKYNHIPHPFVLYLLRNEKTDISFGLKLFGKSMKYLPYFILSFLRLGKAGLGKEKSRFVIDKVLDISTGKALFENGDITSNIAGTSFYEFPSGNSPSDLKAVKIILKSPLSIRNNGKALKEIEPESFMITLVRRLGNIIYFHTDTPLDLDFREIKEKAQLLSVEESNVRTISRDRFSTRQKNRIDMFALEGNFTLKGDLTPFYNYLKLGEIIHVGRGTSFGQGRFEMEEMRV
jgi:CRISPR-associated endoribonuclease Cas6